MVVGFTNLLIVAAAAFAAPLALGLVPAFRLPAVVLEIVLGIALGPSVLGGAKVDEPVQVMSLLGLAFLLLLAGLEVEFEQFRGRLLKLTGVGFAASLGIALVFALGLHEAGLVKSPLLIGIIAAATSLGVVILAEKFGLEAILGAFMTGAVLKLVDRDQTMTHAHFRTKLAEAGFGIFVPFFFVASGLKFDGSALFAKSSTLALVPIFVVLLLAARAIPALLYRPLLDGRHIAAAGLLQATSLGFIVVASEIGMDLGLITKGTGAAFVAAGLVSVLVFPLTALSLLRAGTASQAVATA